MTPEGRVFGRHDKIMRDRNPAAITQLPSGTVSPPDRTPGPSPGFCFPTTIETEVRIGTPPDVSNLRPTYGFRTPGIDNYHIDCAKFISWSQEILLSIYYHTR